VSGGPSEPRCGTSGPVCSAAEVTESPNEATTIGAEKWDDVGQKATLPLVSESQVFWYGDNLTVMREHVADNSVDLIYLDPPFNSQRIYNRFFGELDGTESDAQRRAFDDYWQWGPEAAEAFREVVHPRERRSIVPATLSQTLEMFRAIHPDSNLLAYLSMMAVRLIEMRRVLKNGGALYLHCDPTAGHYLKLLLDSLFGAKCFQNEVIWKRTTAHSGTGRFGPIHDTIFYYTKGEASTWNQQRLGYTQEYLDKYYKFDDGDGRLYWRDNLTASGVRRGDSGAPWRGVDPTAIGRHWAIPKAARRAVGNRSTLEALDELDKLGRIYWPPAGRVPQYKSYREDLQGKVVSDIWDDIDRINSVGLERTGYPTQKPVALLDRIIRTSSNEGDVVLDPFCGCGTAVVAAQRAGRNWIGVDITHVAVSVLRRRLDTEFPGLPYRVRGEPEDVASARRLAAERWDEFQAWIVDKVSGLPLSPTEEKKVAKKGKDGGIDGLLLFRDDPKAPRSHRMILSVKGGEQLNPGMIDALFGVVSRENATAGALLTAYPPTAGMRKTALAYGDYASESFDPGKRYPKIQIVSVEDLFDPKWRGLLFPGPNTSHRSEPPAMTKGPAVAKAEEDLATFVLKASEPKKPKAKQQKLGLPAPKARKG